MNCTTEAKFAEGQFFVRLNGGYYICTSYSRRPFLVLHALFSCAVHMFTCCVHELFTVLIIISVMEKMRENTFPLRVLRNIVFKRHPHRLRASSPSLDSVLFTLLISYYLKNLTKRHPHRLRASSPSLDSVPFTLLLLITSRISLWGTTFTSYIIFSRSWTIYLFNYDCSQILQVTQPIPVEHPLQHSFVEPIDPAYLHASCLQLHSLGKVPRLPQLSCGLVPLLASCNTSMYDSSLVRYNSLCSKHL